MASRDVIRSTVFIALVGLAACNSESTPADAAVGFTYDAYVAPPPVLPPDAAVDGPIDVADDATNDAGADAPTRCTPDALRCRDPQTAERCALTGDAWRALACGNGCADGACRPLLLNERWTLHAFQLAGDPVAIPAAYTFSSDDTIATQTRNAMASAYVFEQELSGVEITGRFSVATDTDDDLIGFVFGWQDPQNFYLVDWKQAGQILAPCGEARVGVSLKRVKAQSPIASCVDLWSADGTAKVTSLTDVTRTATGWKDNTVYDFRITFRPGNLRIEIKEENATVALLTSTDGTFTAGKFGFYSYSQEAVRYEAIRVQPVAP